MPALAPEETKPIAVTLPQAVRALEEKKITYPATVFFSINGQKYIFRRKKGTMLTKFHIKDTFCPEHRRKNLPYNEVEPCGI